MFTSFPPDFQSLSYASLRNKPPLAEIYHDPLTSTTITALLTSIPLSVMDSLEAYDLIPDASSLALFLTPVFNSYVTITTSPPPPLDPLKKKASRCEICGRDWVPLTYHHLIPRQMHKKAVKRGWHEEWRLQSVAWLCRACHSFVHGLASNEELAREWWSVERLKGREDVGRWARWVGRVRWGAR